MNSHVCIPVQFKNQGRCKICGKFMSYQIKSNDKKNEYLDLFRNNVVEIYYTKNFTYCNNTVTLKPEYLKDYQGSGKSKQTDSNTIFAYDIYLNRFISIDITTVEDYTILYHSLQ